MRYLLAARVKVGKRAELLDALESGRFGAGFPYGDLGKVLLRGRVDPSGVIRWVEVCYCREAYGVAMEEELPYLQEYLTNIVVADARSPRLCEGYPVCNQCDCTKKVQPKGEPLRDYLVRASDDTPAADSPPRWLGWRGELTPEEAARNARGSADVSSL